MVRALLRARSSVRKTPYLLFGWATLFLIRSLRWREDFTVYGTIATILGSCVIIKIHFDMSGFISKFVNSGMCCGPFLQLAEKPVCN